ncbi:MAG: transcription repressor NadR [Lachnospiraceae bacterium]
MNGEVRRQRLLKLLVESDTPLSGAYLASRLEVSRQVIVQDIAVLRAGGHQILSTVKGYIVQKDAQVKRVVKVSHTDRQLRDELETIVDLGGVVLDVFVRHKVYGKIQADLNIRSRRDAEGFAGRIESGASQPLKHITSDFHYHTIGADSEQTLDLIEKALFERGYLVLTDK